MAGHVAEATVSGTFQLAVERATGCGTEAGRGAGVARPALGTGAADDGAGGRDRAGAGPSPATLWRRITTTVIGGAGGGGAEVDTGVATAGAGAVTSSTAGGSAIAMAVTSTPVALSATPVTSTRPAGA
jgi:hypothetical protein